MTLDQMPDKAEIICFNRLSRREKRKNRLRLQQRSLREAAAREKMQRRALYG